MTIKASFERYVGGYAGQWQGQVGRRMPTWLLWLMVVMASWLLVRLMWLLVVGPSISPESVSPSRASTQASVPSAQTTYSTQLWGAFFRNDTSPSLSAINQLPIDQSALVLVGTVAASNNKSSAAHQGFAIIRSLGGGDQIYRLNETLPDGRRVEVIEADRVVLSSTGRREVLFLQQRQRSRETTALSGGASDSPQTQTEPLPLGVGVASIGGLGQQWAVSGTIQDSGPLAPVSSGGYRLRPGPEARWFVAAGLQVGDVLLAVNGQPLDATLMESTSPEAWMQKLAQNGSVAVTIERQGAILTLQPSLVELRDVINQRMQSP